ncbi:conjugal transfer protein TraH [Thioalkalivibrio sp. ALgr3]|uniref:conjugal transfer protein TraH n=1 Tax=Thioalkalivibrio sp. ALgr3 TaxID=1239292 RepID=UPI00039FF317|nr:conjugal transfer protein TraH [Thioalkalivibrio sp. ALgr3]
METKKGVMAKLKPLAGAVILATGVAGFSNAAALDGAMDQFLDSYTVNDPGFYQSESAGFVNFGQLTARTGTRYYQPIQIQAPRAEFGCGGIDAFLGGFSFINMDQIVQMARQVGSQAVSTAFYLALDSLSPQLGALMKQMQDWANKANQFNMDSCQTAVDINRGALGAMGMQDSVCQRFQSGESMASDEFASRFECGSEKQWDWSLMNPLSDDGQPQDDGDAVKQALRGNIVWQALKNARVSDDEILELVMSLVGTVVWPEGATGPGVSSLQNQPITPTVTWSELTEAGADTAAGQVTLLQCNDPERGCLETSERHVAAQDANVFRTRVEAAVEEIMEAVQQPPDAGHAGFSDDATLVLALSRLPIFQMIQAETDAGYPGLTREKYTDLLVKELMFRWLERIVPPLQTALLSTANMPGGEAGTLQAQQIADNARALVDQAQREFQTEMRNQGGMHEFIEMQRNLKSIMATRMSPNMAQRINFAQTLAR